MLLYRKCILKTENLEPIEISSEKKPQTSPAHTEPTSQEKQGQYLP